MQTKGSGKKNNAPVAPPMSEEEINYRQDLAMQQQFHELRGEIFKVMLPRHSAASENEIGVVFRVADSAARAEFKARIDEAQRMLDRHKRTMRIPTLYKMMFGEG